MTRTAPTPLAEEDALRVQMYDFLASLLAAPPKAGVLARCAGLSGDDSEMGQAFAALAASAARSTTDAAREEYDRLFIGLGRGVLLPFASYYLTGFLNEKPLALLRRDMARHSIARAAHVHEPEDHIASLLEMMAGLIDGRFAAPADLAAQGEFFARHLAPWAGPFFRDLQDAAPDSLYGPLGRIGALFTEIETEAFRLSAITQERQTP